MSPQLKVLHTKHEIHDLQTQTWHSTEYIWAMDKSCLTHRLVTSFHGWTLTTHFYLHIWSMPPQII